MRKTKTKKAAPSKLKKITVNLDGEKIAVSHGTSPKLLKKFWKIRERPTPPCF